MCNKAVSETWEDLEGSGLRPKFDVDSEPLFYLEMDAPGRQTD